MKKQKRNKKGTEKKFFEVKKSVVAKEIADSLAEARNNILLLEQWHNGETDCYEDRHYNSLENILQNKLMLVSSFHENIQRVQRLLSVVYYDVLCNGDPDLRIDLPVLVDWAKGTKDTLLFYVGGYKDYPYLYDVKKGVLSEFRF